VAIWIIYPAQQKPSYATDLKLLHQFHCLTAAVKWK